jgi:hypothetical protein
MKGVLYAEYGRLNAISENGDVLPFDDVYPCSQPDEQWVAQQLEYLGSLAYMQNVDLAAGIQSRSESEFKPPPVHEKINPKERVSDHEVGGHAVKSVIERGDVIDEYPNEPMPDEDVRLDLRSITEELFDTMKIEDKRYVGLTVWRKYKRTRRSGLSPGIYPYIMTWLRDDANKRGAYYKKWSKKLQDMINGHKKRGDTDSPWLEHYTARKSGEHKIRLNWDKAHSAVSKNIYYDRQKKSPWINPAEAYHNWQRKQEMKEH